MTGFAGRETQPFPPQFPRTVAATFSGDLPAKDIVIRLEPVSIDHQGERTALTCVWPFRLRHVLADGSDLPVERAQPSFKIR